MPSRGVSFVVIAYNEEQAIQRTLAAIDGLVGLGGHEIIVVNDGSTDSTAATVAAFPARHACVRLISQENRGRGAARAVGLSNAGYDLVAMVDADVELPHDWLEQCLAALDSGSSVAGGVAIPEGDATWIHRVYRLDPRPRPLKLRVTGGNFIGRRSTVENIGFDPNMRTAEDILFLHNLDAAGITSTCLPGLICIHRENKGLKATVAWMFESGVSATHQLLRFRPPRVPDLLLLGGVVVIGVSGVALGKKGALAATFAWLLASSTGHVTRSFVFHAQPRYFVRFVEACTANVLLIGSYFLGRLVGFVSPNGIAKA